ncbi:hypothetical protein F0267_00925 [Vibrio coralliilyticus]|uniref:hypothetical protein n=1 Tax=Vibrio coralliilyticus TaxID=190893 RepID=UPI0009B8367A|nr:hypothetical protein [Vibrio coralliilyticus]NOH36784.1 hypothetical protein [Vibrio coralliilyticus]
MFLVHSSQYHQPQQITPLLLNHKISLSDAKSSDKSYSSGSLVLDKALGTQGYTVTRMVEISGHTGAGKSTLALHAVAACQVSGGTAAFLDAEHALDLSYAMKVGVDTASLIFSQPKTAEQAFSTALVLIQSGLVDIIVIDSIAALLPMNHQNKSLFHDGENALEHSRVLANGFTTIRAALKSSSCTVIFTNQLRQKPNNSGKEAFESVGGRPVLNMMATRIRLKKSYDILRNNSLIGHHCKIKVLKHKDGVEGASVTLPLIFNKGMALTHETLKYCSENGYLKQDSSGAIFVRGRYLGPSISQVVTYLDQHPKLRNSLNRRLLSISSRRF